MKQTIIYIIFLFLVICSIKTNAQNAKVKELKKLLTVVDASEHSAILNKIAKHYVRTNYDSAIFYIRKNLALTSSMKDTVYMDSTLQNLAALKKAYQDTTPPQKHAALHNRFSMLIGMYNLDASLEYTKKALQIAQNVQDTAQEAQAYFIIGSVYYYQGEYKEALKNWENNLEAILKLGDKRQIAEAHKRVGVLNKNLGKYDIAIRNYLTAVKIQDEIQDKKGMARTLANIGNIYFFFGENYKKALEYYEWGLTIFKELDDKNGMANLLNSIGNIHQEWKEYDEALKKYHEALEIYKELNEVFGIATTQNNLGRTYAIKKQFKKALEYCEKSLETYTALNNKKQIAFAMRDLGYVYYEWGRYNRSLDYYFKSLKMIESMNLKKEAADYYKDISKVYAAMKNHAKALDYYQQYSQLKDAIFNADSQKQIAELETKYEADKREQQIKLLNKDKALQDTQIKQQKYIIYSFIAVILIVAVFSILLYRQFNEKKKANEKLYLQNMQIRQQKDQIENQNKDLEHKNKQIELQKELVEHKNKEITESIHYARRIQRATLPPEELLNETFTDNFILFRPRDIVSGDFYWMIRKDNRSIIAAADCTGHGVPGAFMSMLGIAFLNQIVSEDDNLQSHEILTKLRALVKASLKQTGKEHESKDGMDIALCIINHEENNLQFSGAYNPLYKVNKNQDNKPTLEQYKADKMPIGIYIKERPMFKSEIIEIKKGDTFYIFSDGYVDQFGGQNGRKFMTKRFKALLEEIYDKNMTEQKEILNETIDKWRGERNQIDDIIVIGFRF